MSDTNTVVINKQLIQDIFLDTGIMNKPREWQITNEEYTTVLEVFLNKGVAVEEDAIEKAVSKYFRVDSKSNRIMTEGFYVMNGKAYFINEEDALEYLNNNGFPCTKFSDAHNAGEWGEIGETYWND